jgi:ABC-type branched-subunit amino acid transport system permease subunit
LCALVLFISPAVERQRDDRDAPVALPSAAGDTGILFWILLAAIPSALLVSVTSYLTTDIAAVPLLWVLPLALYLLTFVAVFREGPWFSHDLVLKIVPFLVAPLAITLLGGDREYWLPTMALNLLALFALALACHGEVYARRPAPALLTEFYLWTSLGGVIGGAFLGIYPGLDFEMLPLAFAVVIIGGMGSLGGAAIGALIVGLADNFGKALFPEISYFTLYAPMALILAVKPTGLFGRE